MRIGYPPTHSLAPAAKTRTSWRIWPTTLPHRPPSHTRRRAAHATGTTDADGAVTSSSNGPYRPFIGHLDRCGAARHSRLSLQAQNRIRGELVVCGQNRLWPSRNHWLHWFGCRHRKRQHERKSGLSLPVPRIVYSGLSVQCACAAPVGTFDQRAYWRRHFAAAASLLERWQLR